MGIFSQLVFFLNRPPLQQQKWSQEINGCCLMTSVYTSSKCAGCQEHTLPCRNSYSFLPCQAALIFMVTQPLFWVQWEVVCVPAPPCIKYSLPHTLLSFSWSAPSLFSPFNNNQGQRQWFPRSPQRKRRSQLSRQQQFWLENLHHNLHRIAGPVPHTWKTATILTGLSWSSYSQNPKSVWNGVVSLSLWFPGLRAKWRSME